MIVQYTIVFRDAAIIMGTVPITQLLIILIDAGSTMTKIIAINYETQMVMKMKMRAKGKMMETVSKAQMGQQLGYLWVPLLEEL